MDYRKAFLSLNLEPKTYLVRYALPMVGSGFALALALFAFAPARFPLYMELLLGALLLGGGVGLAAIWPTAMIDRRRVEINNALPFFLTHMGVLSTSNLPRVEVLRILSEKTDYGALAKDIGRVYDLVTNWNLSLPEATRFVSKSTPSQIFGDFLERLAHALETGQDLETFMKNEQNVVMKEYATVYETAIYQIEGWKDMYISVMMSGVFFVIFAIIMPILGSYDATNLLMGIVVFFVIMEVLLLVVLKIRVPVDRLWYHLDIRSEELERIRRLTMIGGAASLLLLVGLRLLTSWPTGIVLALSISPLAVPGLYARRIEQYIKRREDNYSAFIRSLGATAAARGGSLREVLRRVRTHNYGPLTRMVHGLYARLTWRLHDMMAWTRFSAESGSNLVQSFNAMFVEGIRSGGKAQAVGEIISDNVVRILNLRKSRYSAAGTFRGLVFGLTASMSFVLFMGVGILQILGSLFANAPAISGDLSPVAVDFDVNVPLVEEVLLWLVFFHCLMAAFMLKLVDGGGYPAGLGIFVLLLWVGVLLALASTNIMANVFSGTGAG